MRNSRVDIVVADHGVSRKRMRLLDFAAIFPLFFARTPPSVPPPKTYFGLEVPTLNASMPFAQLVIGPPGSGKSTYCDGMHQFLSAIGRKCSVVNLDPANDHTSYTCALDVRELVTIEEIMEEEDLGPNGAVLYALEDLEENFEWLEAALKSLGGRLVTQDWVDEG